MLQLWWLATSVLQRANKHKSASYIELDKLERSSSQNDKQGDEGSKYNNRRLSRELSPTNPGSLVSSRQSSKEENNLTSTALAMLRSSGSFGSSSERLAGHAREVAAAHGGPPTVRERNESNVSNSSSAVWQASLPPSRSYPQLIAMPGLQDIDDDHKNAMRQLYEICVPWSSQHVPHAFWWQVRASKQHHGIAQPPSPSHPPHPLTLTHPLPPPPCHTLSPIPPSSSSSSLLHTAGDTQYHRLNTARHHRLLRGLPRGKARLISVQAAVLRRRVRLSSIPTAMVHIAAEVRRGGGLSAMVRSRPLGRRDTAQGDTYAPVVIRAITLAAGRPADTLDLWFGSVPL